MGDVLEHYPLESKRSINILSVQVEYEEPLHEYFRNCRLSNDMQEIIDYAYNHDCYYELLDIVENRFSLNCYVDEGVLWQWMEDYKEDILDELRECSTS